MPRTYNPLTLSPEQQSTVKEILEFFHPRPIPCDFLVAHIRLGCERHHLPIPSAVLVARYLREQRMERRNMYAWFYADDLLQVPAEAKNDEE
jgi:hypothetical protein